MSVTTMSRSEEDTHMADPTANPDTRDDSGVGPDRRSTSGTSRWQNVVGTIGLVVLLALGARMFGAGGDHGPGDQGPGENQEQQNGGGHEPPPGVPDH
jgi:hypothetical protein